MDFIEKIIGISIGLVVAGVLVPVGLQSIATSNMTGVNDEVKVMFTLLVPIIAVVVLILYMYRSN